MKLNKTETLILNHAKKVGYVSIEHGCYGIRSSRTFGFRQSVAANALMAKGLLRLETRREDSLSVVRVFSLTESGRKYVFGYLD